MKLIKVLDQYHLYDGDKPIATTIVCNPMLLPILSIKNCEAIANGYDLDELAEKEFPLLELTNHTSDTYVKEENLQLLGHRKTYIKAFQKALSILGDKKFSEFLDTEKELGISDIKTVERIQWYYNTYFDKSQQTEWDVEIVGQFKEEEQTGTDLVWGRMIPVLDKDNCLILKRKES